MNGLLAQLHHALETLHTGDFASFGAWAYVVIGLLVATEGPITTLVGASAAAAGFLDVRLVLAATIVGNVTGDVFWYTVGYTGGIDRAQRIAARVGIDRVHLDAMCHRLHAHAAKAILVAKAAFGLIVPTLLAAGLARVKLRRWLPTVFVAETLWSMLLVFIGYHAAGAIGRTEHGLKILGVIVFILIVTVVLPKILKGHRAQIMSMGGKQATTPALEHLPNNTQA